MREELNLKKGERKDWKQQKERPPNEPVMSDTYETCELRF
jgi:hypothetical protein